MKILCLLHVGSLTPLNACQFASYMDNYGVNLTYLDKSCFSKDNISQLDGLIETSLGVSVIYEGSIDDNILSIRDAVVRHVIKNKQMYVEEWSKCREELKLNRNRSKNG